MKLSLGAALLLALALALVGCADGGTSTANVSPTLEPHESSTADLASPSATPSASPTSLPPTSSPTATSAPSTQVPRAAGPAEHDGKRTLAHIEKLAKGIGPRVSGSKGEADAASYIADQFRSDGYDVEVMEFTFDGDRFRAGSVSAAGKTYEALTLAGSGGGSKSATAVFVGLADSQGIGIRSLKGKVAVADRGMLRFGEKYEAVRDAGAIALVILNNQPGPVSGDLRTAASFPVVAVAGEDAPALREAAKSGATFVVQTPDGTLSKALNVLARPAKGAACDVLVGGHHDTVPGTGGANDNASGAAMVVELARAFASDGVDQGLCFATFGAEESGLYGSTALVKRFQAEGKLPKLMVNLDVTGIGTNVSVVADSAFRQTVLDVAAREGIAAYAGILPANLGSDHQSFQQAGVPVVYLESGEFSTIHTPDDVVGAIQLDELERVGDLAFAAISGILPEIAHG